MLMFIKKKLIHTFKTFPCLILQARHLLAKIDLNFQKKACL